MLGSPLLRPACMRVTNMALPAWVWVAERIVTAGSGAGVGRWHAGGRIRGAHGSRSYLRGCRDHPSV